MAHMTSFKMADDILRNNNVLRVLTNELFKWVDVTLDKGKVGKPFRMNGLNKPIRARHKPSGQHLQGHSPI